MSLVVIVYVVDYCHRQLSFTSWVRGTIFTTITYWLANAWKRKVTGKVMPDNALREALRYLQLSPETIDQSIAAIYEQARNPGHPVDKDLARLCTTDYTRGALCALASYIAAVHSPSRCGSSDRLTRGGGTEPAAEHVRGDSKSTADFPEKIDSWHGQEMNTGSEQEPRRVNVRVSLSRTWSRLRRARSMPTREHATNDPDLSVGTRDQVSINTSSSSCNLPCSPPQMGRANALSGRLDEMMPSQSAGLHAVRPVRNTSSSRRAPVRTGQWKLGHEIGKGSFGAVHIGLNEDSGDLIAVKVLPLQQADVAEPLYREIELMRHLIHPNIVSYLGAEVCTVIQLSLDAIAGSERALETRCAA